MYDWKAEFGGRFAGRVVLVTGATGFIGAHLVQALVALGADVHGVGRTGPAPPDFGHYRACDLRDAGAVEALVEAVRPEVVYHLAGMVTGAQELALVRPMVEVNLIGTLNLLLALANVSVQRIVVAGSSEELGTVAGIPASPYAAAKLAATQYTRMFHLLFDTPAAVARIFISYGPGQGRQKLIPYLVRTLARGEVPRLASPGRVGDFVYVLDVVRGLLQMGDRPGIEGQIVELGSGQAITIGALARQAADLLAPELALSGESPSGRTGEGAHVADLSATRRLLVWEPRWALEAGLLETAKAYKVDVHE